MLSPCNTVYARELWTINNDLEKCILDLAISRLEKTQSLWIVYEILEDRCIWSLLVMCANPVELMLAFSRRMMNRKLRDDKDESELQRVRTSTRPHPASSHP